MAMIPQSTESNLTNRRYSFKEEDGNQNEHTEEMESRASSRSSGRSRSTPPLPMYQYTKEELLKLSKHPHSKKRPNCLDPVYNNTTGKWDPECWFVSKRSKESLQPEESRYKKERLEIDVGVNHKRRIPDPKERVKEERDDIVLSPQRRSFGTGCHVIQHSSLSRCSSSPTDARDSESTTHRETSRKIGSGRIINRERDPREWEREHREYGYNNRGSDRRERFEQDDGDKEGRRYSSRYGRINDRGDRRTTRRNDRIEEEAEPEWFSSGPTSQSETIELVGFDDITHDHEMKKSSKKSSNKKKENFRKQNYIDDGERTNDTSNFSLQKGDITLAEEKEKETEKPISPESSQIIEETSVQKSNDEFDLNEIFKLDWFPDLLPNGTPPDRSGQEIGSSRFSQWFKRDSPVQLQTSSNDSRRSSLQDELVAHVLNGIGELQLMVQSPPPSSNNENYFSPISPIAQTSPLSLAPNITQQAKGDGEKNILEILQNANINIDPLLNGDDFKKEPTLEGKVKSVEELEADLKQLVLGNSNKSEEDKTAFNKLFRHISDNPPSPPSTITMGPLDKSKVLQEEDLLQNLLGRVSPTSSLHLQQTESEMAMPMRCPPSPPMSLHNSNLLNFLQDGDKSSQLPTKDSFGGYNRQQQDLPSLFSLRQQQQATHNQNLRIDVLAKLLGNQSSVSQRPNVISPNSLSVNNQCHNTNSNFNNRNDQQTLNALMHHQHREILAFLMKQQQQQQQQQSNSLMSQVPIIQQRPASSQEVSMTQTLGIPSSGNNVLSPCQSPLPQDNVGPSVGSQGRIPSPLVFGQQPPALSHAPAPIHPAQLAQALARNANTNSNNLQVQNPLSVLPRVPSPQELAVHTQSILQQALIKRKLEEQKEKFRKQEAQRDRSPNINSNIKTSNSVSPAKQGLSPTMAAFTPTSVMRKMHSERQEKDHKSDSSSICDKMPDSPDSKNSIESNNDGLQMNGNGNNLPLVSTEGNGISITSNHYTITELSRGISTGIPTTGNTNIGPRTFHGGQSSLSQNRSQGQIGIPNQGRPIVKGSNQNINSSDHFNRTLSGNKGLVHNKQFLGGTPQANHLLRPDLNMGLAKLMEHRLMQQQHQALAAQRQMNTSPMPPMTIPPAAAFGLGPPRTPGITPHAANLVQPGGINLTPTAVGAASLNLPLLRTMMQTNPALRAQANSLTQLTQLGQLAALQQQLQRDPRQLQALAQARGLHPVTLQQLLLNAQSQGNSSNSQTTSFRSQGIAGNAINIMSGRNVENNLLGTASMRSQLAPGQPSLNRQSPVNLSKWFGNDVLKQKMPDMPPVPHQNALLVEEVERQHQTTVVHN